MFPSMRLLMRLTVALVKFRIEAIGRCVVENYAITERVSTLRHDVYYRANRDI